MDFVRRASTGEYVVEVESKGVIVDDVNALSPLSQAKKSVLGKKKELRPTPTDDVFVGIIASFPCNTEGPAHCRLVDPPFDNGPEDPRKQKLLARLRFHYRQLRLTIGDGRLTRALINRIKILERVRAYESYNGRSLFPGKGSDRSQFFPEGELRTKTWVADRAVGEVVPVSPGRYFFCGIETRVLRQLVDQQFDAITASRSATAFLGGDQLSIHALLSKESLSAVHVSRTNTESEGQSALKVPLRGNLFVSSGGRVLGFLAAG